MKGFVKYIVLLTIIFAFIANVMAQDARIAHPFLWTSYYNPAYCGSEGNLKCDLGAQTTYTYRPTLFVNSHLSFEIGTDTKNTTLGFGLRVNDEYQGYGLLNIATVSPTVSIGLLIGKKEAANTLLRVGLSGDLSTSHINKNKMVLSDQLDPYYGKISDISNELQYIAHENVFNADISAGIFGQTSIPANNYRMPIIINYGFAAFHLIGSSKKSFYAEQGSLHTPQLYNRRFSAQLDYAHPYVSSKNVNMYFKVYGIYEYQAEMNDIQLGFVYNVSRFMVGVGTKVERFSNFTLSDILGHFVYTQRLNTYAIMRIAYSFQIPLTQGAVSETSIHCLSLHFSYDYKAASSSMHYGCGNFTRPTDVAWYEMNNTSPGGKRRWKHRK